jgi:hemin uptake protein HemP
MTPVHESLATDGPTAATRQEPRGRPRTLESTALFAGNHEVVIRHGGREYRLRRTRLDKLILTA